MRRHRPNTGLTLLEVIISISLTIMLCGAVYSLHYYALIKREDRRAANDVVFAQRRILDLLANEVQSAMVYPMLSVGMTGQPDQISFMQHVVPPNSVFYEPSATEGPSIVSGVEADSAYQPQHDVQLVGFRLNEYEDEDGELQIGGLERTCQRTLAAQVAEEGQNIEVSFLTKHVKFLNLTYFDGRQWIDTWNSGDLPLAVRIEIGAEPLDEEMTPEEYPHETAWRVVMIPAGGASPGGGRGGGRGARGAGGGDRYEGGDVNRGGDVNEGGDVYRGGNVNEGGDVYTGSGNRRGGGNGRNR